MIYGTVSAVVAGSVIVDCIIAVVVTLVLISAAPQSGIRPTQRPIIKRLVVPFVGLKNPILKR